MYPVFKRLAVLFTLVCFLFAAATAVAQNRRGANVYPNTDNEESFKHQVRTLSQQHGNLIRVQMAYDNRIAEAALLKRLIQEGFFAELDVKVILDLHFFENHTPSQFSRPQRRKFIDYWKFMAREFRNMDQVFGFDLLNETNGDLKRWRMLAIRTIREIRAIDRDRRVIFGHGADPTEFLRMRPLPQDLNPLMYSIHMYRPMAFTHQGLTGFPSSEVSYPGVINGTMWNRQKVRQFLGRVREYQTRHGVKIFAGEFSAVRWADGADLYLKDLIEVFEDYNWPWCYHHWPSDVWGLCESSDRNTTGRSRTVTQRLRVVRSFWANNTHPTNVFGTSANWHPFFAFGGETPLIGDFNGDSATDIVTFAHDRADVIVALSNGMEFRNVQTWNRYFAPGNEVPRVGDFNGDGLDDIVTFVRDHNADVWVRLSNGQNAFNGGGHWHDFFNLPGETPDVGDFNGDGKDDIITFAHDRADAIVALSNGSRFGTSRLWHGYFAPGNQIPAVGDFNGDGKDDIVTFTQSNVADVWVRLSDGTKFTGGGRWHHYFSVRGEIPRVADINGDGKDDILTFDLNNGNVWVAMSTGNGFGDARLWATDFAYHGQVPHAGDFNDDGIGDIAVFTQGSQGKVRVAFGQ